jgi:hypothetical protein
MITVAVPDATNFLKLSEIHGVERAKSGRGQKMAGVADFLVRSPVRLRIDPLVTNSSRAPAVTGATTQWGG